MLLRVHNVSFSYENEHIQSPVLRELSFEISAGEFVAVQGSSGSGKSTLFYLLGCLLKPTKGRVFFNGQDVTELNDDALSIIRNRHIGFVFQQFHLLPGASVSDNIMLPKTVSCELSEKNGMDKAQALRLAKLVGLEHRLDHKPNQLSGGEQQRVAIARALVNDAELILADEPTGNLDSKNSDNIMELLKEFNSRGKTIVLITHDPKIASQCHRRLFMRDGQLVPSDSRNYSASLQKDSVKDVEKGQPFSIQTGQYRRLIRGVIPLALENLNRNRTRAILTLIGVTVGISAVMSMMTVGTFTKDRIIESYQDLGINRLVIRGHHNWRAKAIDLVGNTFQGFKINSDLTPLLRVFPQIELMSPVLMDWGNTATYGGVSTTNKEILVFGSDPSYLSIINRRIETGRNFNSHHVDSQSPVCVIGIDIANQLFQKRSPLNEILFLVGDKTPYPCQVIGVMERMSSNNDWRKPNSEIILPISYFKSQHDFWRNEISTAALQLKPGSDLEGTGKGVRKYFEMKYGSSGEFHVNNDAILFAQMRKFLALFTVMLTFIALVTLGVGAMGINNMMLVSLSERLKEIGLRKALGATHRSIRLQFLTESMFLCAIAGIFGIVCGFAVYQSIIWLASRFITRLTFQWIIDPVALAVSMISIILVGLLSGMIPAFKAEKLQVIEALRNE